MTGKVGSWEVVWFSGLRQETVCSTALDFRGWHRVYSYLRIGKIAMFVKLIACPAFTRGGRCEPSKCDSSLHCGLNHACHSFSVLTEFKVGDHYLFWSVSM